MAARSGEGYRRGMHDSQNRKQENVERIKNGETHENWERVILKSWLTC